MYLMINGNRYTVSKRIVKPDEIRYLSVTPAPEEVSGVIQMFDEGFKVEIPREAPEEEIIGGEVVEGEAAGNEITEEVLPEEEPEYTDFLISEDDADSFERWSYSGTLLILTNVPEPVPAPVPEPAEASTRDMARAIMEGVNEV